MSTKKYELVQNDTTLVCNHELYRIRALRDIPRHGVKAGDLGGYIESEKNLSHDGDAWIGGEAKVYGGARVLGDAYISDSASACGRAIIGEHARVSDFAFVDEYAVIGGSVDIGGHAYIAGSTRIMGEAIVFNGEFC